MIGRALDANNDYIIVNGAFLLVKDGAELVQHVRSRLLMYLGEWYLDTLSGTPYYQQIFVKPVNLANVESIIKGRILSTPGVDKLLIFTMSFDSNTRALTINFKADSIYGEINNADATLNTVGGVLVNV